MSRLCELASHYGTDKGPNWHNYTPHYDRHLSDIKDTVTEVLEIGVMQGASLRMWRDWFTNATITGVEIDPKFRINEHRIGTTVCDVKDFVPRSDFDVIVDDGSHDPDDITAAAHRLVPHLRPGGWYVIEDWAVVPTTSSAMAWLLDLAVDVAHGGNQPFSEIHLYPQIAFLRRTPTP